MCSLSTPFNRLAQEIVHVPRTFTTTPQLEQCVGLCLGTYSVATDALLNKANVKQITGDDTILVPAQYEKTFKTRLFFEIDIVLY